MRSKVVSLGQAGRLLVALLLAMTVFASLSDGQPLRGEDGFAETDNGAVSDWSVSRSLFGSPDRYKRLFGTPDRYKRLFGTPDRYKRLFGTPDRYKRLFGTPLDRFRRRDAKRLFGFEQANRFRRFYRTGSYFDARPDRFKRFDE
ncbi:hypothetical protein BOX15_Mlig015463g1 [Macrostomum lignano]|uniref:Uncharacterized protein n=1 Tax=Macrostomum lignano TaxID=282301 RepID=A0A267F5Z5_9PLAT|nr:hypothetical protein BOX15_Mlig015463g1 [Macrostomum lignano]